MVKILVQCSYKPHIYSTKFAIFRGDTTLTAVLQDICAITEKNIMVTEDCEWDNFLTQ